jgi:hypothetical protein
MLLRNAICSCHASLPALVGRCSASVLLPRCRVALLAIASAAALPCLLVSAALPAVACCFRATMLAASCCCSHVFYCCFLPVKEKVAATITTCDFTPAKRPHNLLQFFQMMRRFARAEILMRF